MTDPILEFTVDPNEFHEMKVGDTVFSPLNVDVWFGETHPTVDTFGTHWESNTVPRGRMCVVLDRKEKWLNLLTPVGVGWCRGRDFTRGRREGR